MRRDLLSRKGFSLLELILAMAVFAVFVAAVGAMLGGVYRSDLLARETLEKTIKLEAAQETARITATGNWDDLAVETSTNTDGVQVEVSLVDGDTEIKQVLTTLDNLSLVSYLTNWQ